MYLILRRNVSSTSNISSIVVVIVLAVLVVVALEVVVVIVVVYMYCNSSSGSGSGSDYLGFPIASHFISFHFFSGGKAVSFDLELLPFSYEDVSAAETCAALGALSLYW